MTALQRGFVALDQPQYVFKIGGWSPFVHCGWSPTPRRSDVAQSFRPGCVSARQRSAGSFFGFQPRFDSIQVLPQCPADTIAQSIDIRAFFQPV